MGTTQSTRKITLVNDDKAGVIKLSESLAYRLRGQIEGQQTAAEVPGPAAAAEPPRAPVAPAPEPPPLITPIPHIPETPKVTYLAPVPETVAPTPIDSEPVAPEPIAQKPLIPESSILEPAAPDPVVSEPAAPESLVPEPAATGESHPLADVPVDTPSGILVDVSEPSPSVLQNVAENADLQPLALLDNVSQSQESAMIESCEPQVSLSLDESVISSEPQSPSAETLDPLVSAETVDPLVPSAQTVDPLVEETAAVTIEAIVILEQVQLSSSEMLLAAAFPVGGETPAVAEATSEATVPPSAETITVSPSLSLPIEVNEVPRKELPETASPPAAATVSPPDLEVAVKAGPPPTLSQPAGNIPPWSIYAEEAHLMVMRLREEKEQEIQKLNLNWRDKMDAREKEFTKMAHLSEEEATAALKDVEKLFLKASCSPICQNHQEAVMNCYQDHPRQSLRCAKEVENFTQCVDLSRLQSVIKQRAN
ncbi:MICOS complex subunit mic25-like [Homarus americanus]|uniref:MICOS complex subunit mic25-like n=1 Tax=Homarus americanus TaxID=6706 RepID=A0A8J5MK12_HOMAM|nr:MICOS complex subunit mic25-like [Homarus americanus]